MLFNMIPLWKGKFIKFDCPVSPSRSGKLRTSTGSFTKSPPLTTPPPQPTVWPMIGVISVLVYYDPMKDREMPSCLGTGKLQSLVKNVCRVYLGAYNVEDKISTYKCLLCLSSRAKLLPPVQMPAPDWLSKSILYLQYCT